MRIARGAPDLENNTAPSLDVHDQGQTSCIAFSTTPSFLAEDGRYLSLALSENPTGSSRVNEMGHMSSRQWVQRTARVFAARRERRGLRGDHARNPTAVCSNNLASLEP